MYAIIATGGKQSAISSSVIKISLYQNNDDEKSNILIIVPPKFCNIGKEVLFS